MVVLKGVGLKRQARPIRSSMAYASARRHWLSDLPWFGSFGRSGFTRRLLFSDSLCTFGFVRSFLFLSRLSFACFPASAASALIAVLLGLHLAERFSERIRHTAEGLADFDHAFGFPVFLIAQHGPSDDGDLACQSHSGFLFAGLLIATDSFIDFFSPRVVTQRCPCAFNQDRSSQWITAFGDAAIAICLAGLILARDQAEVSGDLSTVFETMRIVDTGNEDLCCARSDTGYGSNAFDAMVIFADGFQLLHDELKLRAERIELR